MGDENGGGGIIGVVVGLPHSEIVRDGGRESPDCLRGGGGGGDEPIAVEEGGEGDKTSGFSGGLRRGSRF